MSYTSRTGRGGILVAGLGFGVAAGVAAGALLIGPNLSGGGAGGDGAATLAQVEGERDAARQEGEIDAAQADSADAVVAEFGPASLTDVLLDRPVLVLRTADAADEDVAAVTEDLAAAGAQAAGEITLLERFSDQDGADALKTIVTNTLPAGAQLSETNLQPGNHAGEALGSALLLDPATGEPQATEDERALLLGALKEAGFIDYEAGTILPAQAIVLITGDSDGTGEASFSAGMLTDFARALDSRGNGVVVAGRIRTASDEGVIGRLRETPETPEAANQVSTVDSVDRAWGQLATVLAVREQLDGGAGQYGSAASAEAASPGRLGAA